MATALQTVSRFALMNSSLDASGFYNTKIPKIVIQFAKEYNLPAV